MFKSCQALRIIRTVIFSLFSLIYCDISSALTIESPWSEPSTFSGNRPGFSSPVIAEVDGDTSNGKEIVAASINGILAAFRADGTLLWEIATPDSGCGGRSEIHSRPAVGDLYGTGTPYVVVGYGGFSKRCEGGVMVVKGDTGTLAWNFSTKAFHKKYHIWAVLNTVFSSPAMADTDGDGRMEIGFGSFDRYVYLLNYNGSVRWVYTAADTVWSSPTFADLNGDGTLEMVLGTDISGNSRMNPPTKNGGNLYAFKTTPNKSILYSFRNKKAFLWMKPVEQTLFSTPKVGEIIPESAGSEVAINSGCYFPEGSNQKVGRWTKIFSGKTGKLLRTLAIEACSSSSPALADLNGDGAQDVIVTVNGSTSIGGDGKSHIEAFDARNNVQLWNTIPYFKNRNYAYGGNFISPVMQDVTGDGISDVITSVASGVGIYNGQTGAAITCEASGSSCEADNLPYMPTGDVLINTPAVGDIDGDGLLDIVAAGKTSSGTAGVYRWEIQ